MERPRPITGSDGSRVVSVELGGADAYGRVQWLLVLNHDDGTRQWQEHHWEQIPPAMATQMNNLAKKDRTADVAAFGMQEQWFIQASAKPSKSRGHCWWGGVANESSLRQKTGQEVPVSMAFGPSGHGILVTEGGGWLDSGAADSAGHLMKRMRENVTQAVRLSKRQVGGYWIQDNQGTEWCGLGEHLGNELQNGGHDDVLNVAEGPGGSWIVIRPNRYIASQNVSDKLTSALSKFYAAQKQRRELRNREIAAWDTRERQRVETERLAAEAAAREQARLANEQRVRERELERQASQAAEQARRDQAERERLQREQQARAADEQTRAAQAASRAEREMRELATGKPVMPAAATPRAEQVAQAREILQPVAEMLTKTGTTTAEIIAAAQAVCTALDVQAAEAKKGKKGAKAEAETEQCVICMDDEATMAAVPCGHKCLCAACALTLCTPGAANAAAAAAPLCPLCRAPVERAIKIYAGAETKKRRLNA
eukprot:COSAG02_NODE_437_length_22340_cov_46.269952_6_plen_486_part_00